MKHLTARILETYPRGTPAATEAKRVIADFCSVNVQTVTGWFFRANHMPRGEQYIKLMCFLDLNGYKVIEFERMSLKCRNFARLIGYGLITGDTATEMVGYSQSSELFRALKGDAGLSAEKEEKLWELWKARKDKLEEAEENAASRYRLNFSRGAVNENTGVTAEMSGAANLSSCPKDGVVLVMQGLLKLLDSGVLQELTEDEWAALRGSGNTILRLSSHLSTLSAKLVRPS